VGGCVLAALGVVTGACGLAPHDETTPAFGGDGTSGWQSLGSVELCVGGRRVAAPALSDGAGFCVEPDRAARACGGDDECPDPERCFCGHCAVRPCGTSGRGCAEDEVCRGGRCAIQCTRDDECGPGQKCSGGRCAVPCATSAQCPYGERCDTAFGVCAVKTCGDDGDCPASSACELPELLAEMHEPSLIEHGGVTWIYLELQKGAGAAIHRARAVSERAWVADPELPVLEASEPSDAGRVGAPVALAEGAGVSLLFAAGGASIGRAVSTDGISFTREPDPLLTAEPGGWEAGRIDSPSVVDFAGARFLLYEGGDAAGIGVARLEGPAATRISSQPLLAPGEVEDPLLWRRVTDVGTPHAVVERDFVRVYFTGRGTEGSDAIDQGSRVPADENDSIGLFTTRDFATKSLFPAGPAFARVTNLRAYLGEREPFVRLQPERALLYFVGADATGKQVSGIGAAQE
jgi:hypothetical protein